MPEIKNNFLQGKMNKDLDERLIPNGQYRDAWNIEVSTAEDSSVGTIKNILGNKRVEDIVPSGFKCVGSIANEKNNKLYWFVSSYDVIPADRKDAIIEYDAENDVVTPIVVDLNAGTSKAALKFGGNIIIGINIIDDLLFWTDNSSDPKKINIKECAKGTPDFHTHTQLIFESGSFNGITLKYVATSSASAGQWQEPVSRKGRYFWYQTNQIEKLFDRPLVYNQSAFTNPYEQYKIRHYRDGKYLGVKRVKLWDGLTLPSDNGSHGRVEPYVHHPTSSNYIPGTIEDEYYPWQVGDVIFGDGVNIDIEERHITVIKPKPLNAFSVKINHTENLDGPSNVPNLFETTFPRFSYRYKYKDGEFSSFAPFTNAVFNPKYTKNVNKSTDVSVFYNKDTAYDVKDPHNKAMVNSIHSVELTDFITAHTPEDAVAIEILYKQENSPVIYSIGTIKHLDSQWHDSSSNEGYKLGVGKAGNGFGYQAAGGLTKGKYIVTTENIYAALPANQLLRPYDNVPRKALAQEITGNRIVYGNYLQNYNIGVVEPRIKVSYGARKNTIASFDTQGLPSIKSQRNYQLGVIYCDEHGRETPVFTSNEGAVSIPWQESDGSKNASKSLQLNASVSTNFPEWVDSLKFFVKETSNEYYNLAMQKAWVTKNTYELDNSEGHLWISFPSSDRNKISEEDYIILKKKIGTGENQISFENKFKVIDIKNEAPDAIKYELVNYGTVTNTGGTALTSVIGNNALNERIDTETDRIKINVTKWESDNLNIPLQEGMGQDDVLDAKDLYISWRRLSAGVGVSSKKYKIIGGRVSTNYILNLSTPITKIDADIAHKNSDSSTAQQTNLHEDLIVQIEKKQLKDVENFSGKFFVKISKNQVTDLIESGEPTSILDQYEISSKSSSWYWEDNINTGIAVNADGTPSNNYGLVNYYGYPQSPSGANSIQDANNNVVGPLTADNHTLKLTDHSQAWAGILSNFGPTFFVDSMHVASGQSSASDYAKYNCILWSGCTQDDGVTKEDSAWSYPPFKTWLTDFQKKSEFLGNPLAVNPVVDVQVCGCWGGWPEIEVDPTLTIELYNKISKLSTFSNWFEGNLISTSEEVPVNSDWNDLKVDGWVGNLQNVTRDHPLTIVNENTENQVNGLEGFVTTNSYHATGPRRWFSGITGNSTEQGVGVDTKTYSENGEIGRHFMHISFFAPGQDLHDGDWSGLEGGKTLYGPKSFAANLQGIWGGGHFTASNPNQKFGTGTEKHWHLCMEGNHSVDGSFLPSSPGPGVGYGYDTRYKELHERQWDPTFNRDGDPDNKIRDFIRNLHAGAQFKFNKDTPAESAEVYTIKKVAIKKLYNHTSWRKPYNRFISSSSGSVLGVDSGYIHTTDQDLAYRSVEQVGLEFLDELNDNGAGATNRTAFEDKIEQFGKAHNRRVCYIVELDKNPTVSSYNPIANGNAMSADVANNNFTDIEFLEPVESVLLSDLSKFPAIWEVDPKKQEVDLDIYYEVSDNIPVRINNNTSELIAPIGCAVEILDSPITGISKLLEWDGTIATLEPGFPRGDGTYEIDYTGVSFKFIREDGSFIIVEAGGQQLIGDITGNKTLFGFREDIGDSVRAGLSWFNCFSFGNGVESNRIRDDFNEMFITNGVKASTTTQETYEEERRFHGLIYSGLYNSNSGVNDLNQFIMAEKITKDLNPTYGSIQKLFQRRISLIAFCEDRVLSITSNKDAIYNADGNMQLVATENVLGDVNPFVGNFGISKNPESFASESYRAYFTDKARGAVLRLSKDGLTPISKTGMHDWFRDNLHKHTSLIGTYDSYKENYNITLSDAFSENILQDTYLETGVESTSVSGGITNRVGNAGPYSGDYFKYPWEDNDVATHSNFAWGTVNAGLTSNATITNHEAIPEGGLQAEIQAQTEQVQVVIDAGSGPVGTYLHTLTAPGPPVPGPPVPGPPVGGPPVPGPPVAGPPVAGPPVPGPITNFVSATYSDNLPTSGGSFPGHYYAPVFDNSPAGATFGPNAVNDRDSNIFSRIRRRLDHNHSSLNNNNWGSFSGTGGPYQSGTPYWVDENNPTAGSGNGGPGILNAFDYGLSSSYSGHLYQEPVYPSNNDNTSDAFCQQITGVITQTSPGNKSILFDRVPNPQNSWIEFRDIGATQGTNTNLYGYLNAQYHSMSSAVGSPGHNKFYNGDELHITFEVTAYITHAPTYLYSKEALGFGYNFISPKLELYDGNTLISSDKLIQVSPGTANASNLLATNQSNPSNYRHIHTTLVSVFGSGFNYGNATSLGYDSWSGGPSDFKNFGYFPGALAGYRAFAEAQFPSTSNISDLEVSGVNNHGTKTITYGASFKFRDPAQQNNLGQYTGSGQGTQEVEVINDLRIRIGQTENFASSTGRTGMEHILRNPLWQINNIKAVKGFGVTAPHIPFSQGADLPGPPVAGPPVSGPPIPGPPVSGPPIPGPPVPGPDVSTDHHVGDPQSGCTLGSHAFVDVTLSTYVAAVAYVSPVPSQDVPAWTEVNHYNPTWFDDWVVTQGQGTVYLHANMNAVFGNNYSPTTVTGMYQNTNPSQTPNTSFTYVVPNDWAGLGNPGSGPANGTPFYHTANNPSGSIYPGIGYGNPSVETHNNDYIYIESPSNEDVKLTQNISTSPWVANTWYLVDVEYHISSNPNTGTGNGNGWVDICGVLSNGGYANSGAGNEIHPDGVGVYSSYSTTSNVHCRLVPVTRTEYGSERTVLRGIFKFAQDSYKNGSQGLRNDFKIKFWGCINPIRVTKIITKKLDTPNITGGATDWNRITGTSPTAPLHAFDKTELYWKGNKLCWQVRADQFANNENYKWEQDLGGRVPNITPLGWRLDFKVSGNPNTQNFVGRLRGAISATDANSTTGYEGVYFKDIQHTGDYRIMFNMNGDASRTNLTGTAIPWSIERKVSGNWTDYSSTATLQKLSSNFLADYADKITFFNMYSMTTDMEMGVSNIFLTDETVVFQGGSAGSWNFDGFNTSTHNYIHWNVTNQDLVFFDCPAVDPNATTAPTKLININQWIDDTTPINRYEKYRIEFSYLISSGKISIYYFNSEGFGFKVANISANTPTNFDQIVMIGDDGDGNFSKKWEEVNPINAAYAPDLKETFVIGLYDDTETVNGWIDDVSMTRVYDVSTEDKYREKTVTFSENVNGWTSFKTFVPESGLSLSKKYFTIENGALYQHYVPRVNWAVDYVDADGNTIKYTAEEANNYNTFYGVFDESSVTAVLNGDPSTVKTFSTLNYEGSQAHVIKPDHVDKVTINNAHAWAMSSNIDGWNCTEIKTDMDAGSVVEFIKKEGKWFNYIKGKAININQGPDTSRFSVQGIGVVASTMNVTV